MELERQAWANGSLRVAGIDEAGRGALAGPVVAAAVVLPRGETLPKLDDSKRLRPSRRVTLYDQLVQMGAHIGIAQADPSTIDAINVLHASLGAMVQAAQTLDPPPDHVLVDGNMFVQDSPWPYQTIVKGDQLSMSIAAASIVAKVTRDRIMHRIHEDFPVYDWKSNVGYPTRAHYDALARHGPTPHHRQSFRLR